MEVLVSRINRQNGRSLLSSMYWYRRFAVTLLVAGISYLFFVAFCSCKRNTPPLVVWLNHCSLSVYFIGVGRTFYSVLFQLCAVFSFIHQTAREVVLYEWVYFFVLWTIFFCCSGNPSAKLHSHSFRNKIKGFLLSVHYCFCFFSFFR